MHQESRCCAIIVAHSLSMKDVIWKTLVLLFWRKQHQQDCSVCQQQSLPYLIGVNHDSWLYFMIRWNLSKSNLNKVPIYEIPVNFTCLFWTQKLICRKDVQFRQVSLLLHLHLPYIQSVAVTSKSFSLTSLMERCTCYNFMWLSLCTICNKKSMVSSEYFGFPLPIGPHPANF